MKVPEESNVPMALAEVLESSLAHSGRACHLDEDPEPVEWEEEEEEEGGRSLPWEVCCHAFPGGGAFPKKGHDVMIGFQEGTIPHQATS